MNVFERILYVALAVMAIGMLICFVSGGVVSIGGYDKTYLSIMKTGLYVMTSGTVIFMPMLLVGILKSER